MCSQHFVSSLINIYMHDYCLIITAIEGEYDGPKLDEDNKITVQFTEDLMRTFKAQGKLHRRYAYQVNSSVVFLTVSTRDVGVVQYIISN